MCCVVSCYIGPNKLRHALTLTYLFSVVTGSNAESLVLLSNCTWAKIIFITKFSRENSQLKNIVSKLVASNTQANPITWAALNVIWRRLWLDIITTEPIQLHNNERSARKADMQILCINRKLLLWWFMLLCSHTARRKLCACDHASHNAETHQNRNPL